jgi:high-affinity nickel-transport protein
MVIAYTLGLQHAVDADHLAAIDNVTRKLIHQESAKSLGGNALSPPVCVGLFFSLGHSTIVIVASAIVMGAASTIRDKFGAFGETGGIIGASVSSAFLLLIGFLNAFVFFKLVQELREIQRTGEYRYRDPVLDALEGTINSTSDGDNGRDDAKESRHSTSRHQRGGIFIRILRPLFNLIDRSWKMYPLGVLFGLGFDTELAQHFSYGQQFWISNRRYSHLSSSVYSRNEFD